MIDSEYFTPASVAKLLGVAHEKILTWIRNGELVAIDLSAHRRQRPRYKIAQSELDAFLKRRSSKPAPTIPKRTRRQEAVEEEFY